VKRSKMNIFSVIAFVISIGSSSAFTPSFKTHPCTLQTNVATGPTQPFSRALTSRKAAAADEFYIDMERRNIMNLILVGSAGLTIAGLGVPYVLFFFPAGTGGGGGGVTAKDKDGAELFLAPYLESHPVGDHSLAQGLKGDATYIIVKEDKTIETYGLNAVCTHLGCVVPWSAAQNKFMCPCHGSQYAPTGAVVRGPAPLPLALAHCDEVEGKIVFSTWTEQDFRTGGKGWWN